jgi:hypothetical protein
MILMRDTAESVQPALDRLLEDPGLPARAALAGRQLRERLSSPIRVAILGGKGSGKSQILNLIAGERLLPDGASLPDTEVRFGPERRYLLVDGNGEETPVRPADLMRLGQSAAPLLRIEAPLPVLSTLTLIEVAARDTAPEERAAVKWAAARADVVVWCSQTFDQAERWLWSSMPDRLKDHGFLALTKADELMRTGTLADRIAELADVVADEFHSLVPVATLQGLAALTRAGGVDHDALGASGAEALIAELLAHVEQGRRADLDAALLFLNRYGAASLPGQPVPAAAAEAEEPAQPAAPDPAPPSADVPVAAVPEPADPDVLRGAIEILRECGGSLARQMDADGRTEAVLEGCAQAAQAVADMLESGPAPLFDEALDVSERLVLLGLEGDEMAAADAVTLLLQLRRDLGQAMAA